MADNKNEPYVEYLEVMGRILACQNPSLANMAPDMLALLFGISNRQPLNDNGGNSLASLASYTMNVGMELQHQQTTHRSAAGAAAQTLMDSASYTMNVGMQLQHQQTTDRPAAGAAAQTLMDSISRSQNIQSGNQQVNFQPQSPQLASHLQYPDPSIEDRQHLALGMAHSSGQNSFPPTFQPQQVLGLQQTNQSVVGGHLRYPQRSKFPPEAYFPPQAHDGATPPEQRGLDTLATLYGLGTAAIPLVGASLPFAANTTLGAPEGPDTANGCTIEASPYITNDESIQTGQKKRPGSGDSQNSDDCGFNLRKDQDNKKPRIGRRSYSAVLFAEKLFKMVTDQEASGKRNVVEFLDGGGGFWLHDPDAIPALMAKYNFRGTKFSGFRRQLTSYGFRVDRNEGPKKGAFKNPLFSRGRPDLCRRIFRESYAQRKSQDSSDEGTKLDRGQHRWSS